LRLKYRVHAIERMFERDILEENVEKAIKEENYRRVSR